MNKEELIEAIATETDQTKIDTRKFLDAYIKITEDTLASGGSIQLIGFATFAVSERSARKGRNPSTGMPIDIAASKVVKFTAGKHLKDAVNKAGDKSATKSKPQPKGTAAAKAPNKK